MEYRLAIALLLLVAATAAADSQQGSLAAVLAGGKDKDPEAMKRALIDLEYDAAKCTAYYKLTYAQAERSGYSGPQVDGTKQAGDDALRLTTMLSNGLGMSMEAVEAQLKEDMESIVKDFGKDMVNAPAVLEKTGIPCKNLLEHPDQRLAHWQSVESKKPEGK